jgi:predicted ATPase
VTRCVPEIEEVMAPPSEKPGHCALRVRQSDGQAFDAPLISDGILYFIGLGVAVLKGATSPLVFIEEPENGIHPPAIHELVDLLRRIRRERDCQFVIATHSRTFIDQFRDEPDAILRFRRARPQRANPRTHPVPGYCAAVQAASVSAPPAGSPPASGVPRSAR